MITEKALIRITILALAIALLYEVGETRKSREALGTAQKQQAKMLAKVHRLENSLAAANARLKAAEDDGTKLLGVIDNATANEADGTVHVPITQDYVEARYKHARDLAKSGNNEEALKEFLWCYDEGMPRFGAYSGLRCILPKMIAELGSKYPPALIALREHRDKAEQQLATNPNDDEAASSFAAINHYLKDDARNLQLYDQLPVDDARRKSMGMWVYDELTTAQRYDDAAQAKPYRQMRDMIEMLTDTSDPNTTRLRQSQRTDIVRTTAGYVEVLAGSGDLSHARELAARILAYDGSPEAQTILQEHAARAGHPELLTTPHAP